MTTDQLVVWIEKNVPLSYDDLSDVDGLIDKLNKIAREKTPLDKPNQYKSFEAAMDGGMRDYLKPATDIYNKIEEADFISELPKKDIESANDTIQELVGDKLDSGLNRKEEELDLRGEASVSGEIETAETAEEIDNLIKVGERLVSDERLPRIIERAESRKQELADTSGVKDIIEQLNTLSKKSVRSSEEANKLIADIGEVIAIAPGTGSTARKLGPKLASDLSMAQAEAVDKVYNLEHGSYMQ